MPPSPFPTGAASGPVGPYNASLPSTEYMGPTSMPNMTLPQHFHVQSGSHQHPPGHPQGSSLPPPDQNNLPYQPQGYIQYAWFFSFHRNVDPKARYDQNYYKNIFKFHNISYI